MHPALKTYLSGKVELSADQEGYVNSLFKLQQTERNEILIPAGQVANKVYLVSKGCLRVFLTSEQGIESTRFLIFEGRMGTAFPSFISRQPSLATVQSPEPSELLVLSYENRELLNQQIPGWETMERKGMERDYIEAIERIENFLTGDAKARYNFLLGQNPRMIQRLPAKIVADYLGISPETLSRLKAKK
jgi:CRP/FNR family cyclic AMP-dependent transcriptional regulator